MREPSKCREWEKERRNRLKTCFTALSKVLPNYDPSIIWSKLEILQKATSYIEELKSCNRDLLNGNKSTELCEKDELRKLEDNVAKLVTRNQQLVNLLVEAGITVPTECGVVKSFKEPLKYSNKIPPENVKLLDNQDQKRTCKKKAVKRKASSENSQVLIVKKAKKAVRRKEDALKKTKKTKPASVITQLILQPSSGLALVQPNLLQTFPSARTFITVNKESKTSIRNKSVSIASQSTSQSKVNSKLTNQQNVTTVSNLPAGALFMPNGKFLPVLTPQANIQPLHPSSLVLPAQSNKTIVLLPQNIPSTSSFARSTYPAIAPNLGITKTTTVNKVPIPAVASKSYTSAIINNKNTLENKTPKTKKILRKVKQRRKLAAQKLRRTVVRKKISEHLRKTAETVNSVENKLNDKSLEKGSPIEKTNGNSKCDNLQKDAENVPKEPTPNADELVSSETSKEVSASKISEKQDENKNQPINDHVETVSTTEDVMVGGTEMNDLTKSCDSLQHLEHSELSNDIFASLQVPTGSHHPESISPTAAFLLAFPLVSTCASGKHNESMEEENPESRQGTPTLLQIGNIDNTKSVTPNLLALDNFSSFFSSTKETCSTFYSPFEGGNVSKDVSPGKTKTMSKQANETTTPKPQPQLIEKNKNDPVQKSSTVELAKTSAISSDVQQKESVSSCAYIERHQSFLNKETYDISDPFSTCATKSLHSQAKVSDIAAKRNPTSDIKSDTTKKTMEQRLANITHVEYSCTSNIISPAKAKNIQPKQPEITTTTSNTVSIFNPFTDLPPVYTTQSLTSRYQTEPYYATSSNYNYNYNEVQTKQDYPKQKSNKYQYQPSYNYRSQQNSTKNYESKRASDMPHYGMHRDKTNNGTEESDKSKSSTHSNISNSKQPYNWMTTPDVRYQQNQNTDFLLPTFNKDVDYGQNIFSTASFVPTATTQTNFYNTTAPIYTPSNDFTNVNFSEPRKTGLEQPYHTISTNAYQKPDNQLGDENQFTWSPTKLPPLLDTHQHNMLVPNTLPTLIGDLALGTTTSFDRKIENQSKERTTKDADNCNRGNQSVSYGMNQSQGTFLSVSQLVEHNKSDVSNTKMASRRNSNAPRSSSLKSPNSSKPKKSKTIESLPHCFGDQRQEMKVNDSGSLQKTSVYSSSTSKPQPEWSSKPVSNNRCGVNSSSSYSAEALIGNTNQIDSFSTVQRNVQTSKTHVLPALSNDSTLPIFPSADINTSQENVHKQNYQMNSYSQAPAFATGNLHKPTYQTSIMSDFPSSDYNIGVQDNCVFYPNLINKNNEKMKNLTYNRQQNQFNSNISRKTPAQNNTNIPGYSDVTKNKVQAKKKPSNEMNLPSFPELNFLSIPTINSPMLDDFHHTTYIPSSSHQTFTSSPQTGLYPKPFSNSNHDTSLLPGLSSLPRTSSSIDTTNMGSSLTNFNLSTIFPEINKGTFSIANSYNNENSKRDSTFKTLPHIGLSNSEVNFAKTTYQPLVGTQPSFGNF